MHFQGNFFVYLTYYNIMKMVKGESFTWLPKVTTVVARASYIPTTAYDRPHGGILVPSTVLFYQRKHELD